MATTTPTDDGISEECPACETTTIHDVSVQILTESTDAENAAYSREPYRVSVCRACGREERVRMNNA
ncbi:hypothetical protein [Halosegnis sp.]|uniref:DUF7835 family putative zinc beta-ribbon protein n=1 Tax=Halosegnis sp. TaxID=2864959 RepID=UPI0035D4402B